MSNKPKKFDRDEFLSKLEDAMGVVESTVVLRERARVLKFIEPHLKACSYEAVRKEECPVCAFSIKLVKQIVSEDETNEADQS